jgi:SAM-dependent methyltransferase
MSPDFAALWRQQKLEDVNGRVKAEVDLAFWEEAALHYDASHGDCLQTLKFLSQFTSPNDTLLEVGAGTGRFALPLARQVKHITALDHSPAMLNILHQKATEARVSNLSLVQAEWEQVCLEPHEIVLAAWSLYRQIDILAAIRKLVEATRRTLIIVESDDNGPQQPHHSLVTKIWPPNQATPLSKSFCFLGVLWQLGLRPELRVVYESRFLWVESVEQLAQQLAPTQATPTEKKRFAEALRPLLKPRAEGWHYDFTYPVEILIWQRK